MNRFLLALSFTAVALSSANTFATPLTSADKMKSCLAAIYLSQNSFREKNHTYAAKVEDLSLQKASDCQDLKKSVRTASNEKFIVEVQDKTSTWTIDSSKTMEKIK